MRTTRHSQKFSGGKPSPACLHIQQQMPLFLDGELSEPQAQSVLRHLSDCPVCQREREQWQQSERALASARQYVPAPGDLRAGFYARLDASHSTRRPRPHIDWRVAVPTLAACSLAFGWFTARQPVVSSTTEVSSTASHQETAQASAPPAENIVVSKAPAGSSGTAVVSGSEIAKRAIVRASSPPTQAASQRTRNDLRKTRGLQRSGRQIALLNSRQNQSEHSGQLESRHRALASSFILAYKSAEPASILGERLTGEELARSKSSRQDTALYADAQTKMDDSLELSKASSKQKATLQDGNSDMAKLRDGVQAAKSFAYVASGLNSREFGELKEQTTLSASNASANTDQSQTFALGLSGGARQDTNALRRGLGWQFVDNGNEGVDLQVRDSKRGFTNGTRLAGEVQEQNGRRVLIIQAEDAEPPAESSAE